MKWASHIAVAAALTIPINPAALPFSALGATAPDWLEFVLKIFGIKVKHRGVTHQLLSIVIFFILALLLSVYIGSFLAWFAFGALTHWFCDALTVTGVPVSPFSQHNTTLFGGKIRTGEPKEYFIAFGFLAVVLMIFKPATADFVTPSRDLTFNQYFMNYQKLYNLKIIDEKELKELRWKFF